MTEASWSLSNLYISLYCLLWLSCFVKWKTLITLENTSDWLVVNSKYKYTEKATETTCVFMINFFVITVIAILQWELFLFLS